MAYSTYRYSRRKPGKSYARGSRYGRSKKRTAYKLGRKKTYGKSSMYRPYGRKYALRSSAAQAYRRGAGYLRSTGLYRLTGATAELKFLDLRIAAPQVVPLNGMVVSPAEFSPPAPDLTTSWCAVPQGSGASQRIGRNIEVREWFVKGQFLLPDAPGPLTGSSIVRLILFIDHQCNGTTARPTDVLSGVPPTVNSFLNPANSGRFSILSDTTHSVTSDVALDNGGGVIHTGRVYRPFSFSKKNCKLPVEYSSTGATLSEIRSNNLCVLCISAEAAILLDRLESRINYCDA